MPMQENNVLEQKWHKIKIVDMNPSPSAKINVWKIVDMVEWCNRNTVGQWKQEFDCFSFEHDTDAMKFFKTWMR